MRHLLFRQRDKDNRGNTNWYYCFARFVSSNNYNVFDCEIEEVEHIGRVPEYRSLISSPRSHSLTIKLRKKEN
jgi:hypothetical protein